MTSREIGAVTGVAVLGSLVISQLHASLTAQLNHLGIPAQFQALVINAIETSQIPQNTSAYAGYGKIVQEVIAAGLHGSSPMTPKGTDGPPRSGKGTDGAPGPEEGFTVSSSRTRPPRQRRPVPPRLPLPGQSAEGPGVHRR